MNLKNRLPAIITGIKKGKLNAHVGLEWEGVNLSVIITSASCDEMALNNGDRVDALFKASDVIIAKGLSGQLSARNVFPGKVTKIIMGFPLAMVTLESGDSLVAAEITISSLEDMDIKPGDTLQVVIKSSELILAKRA